MFGSFTFGMNQFFPEGVAGSEVHWDPVQCVNPWLPKLVTWVMECHLSDGEGAWVSARGWDILTRYSGAHLNAWLGLWSQTPGEGLDSVSVWSCALGERQRAGMRVLVSPRLAACMLRFLLVDERVWSLQLWVRSGVSNLLHPKSHLEPVSTQNKTLGAANTF